jgi:putative ABC transport system permease protein
MSFLDDLKLAWRLLLKRPAFLTAVLFILGMSLGAATAVFSVVRAVLLKPLSYPEADRLAVVWNQKVLQDAPRLRVSAPEFLDYAQSAAFEDLAAYYVWDYTWTGGQEPLRIRGAAATASLFPVLGVQARLGRTFTAADDFPGTDHVAVVSHGFLQRRLGGDRGAIGKSLTLDGRLYEIVGVMPPQLDFPQREVEVWVPLAIDPADLPSRRARQLQVVGRLAPESSPERAQAEMTALAARMQQSFPDVYPKESGWGVLVVPLIEEVVGPVRPGLLLLSGAVVLVLLIACANVACLLLVRMAARQKEIAVRVALGAGRSRLVRQLLTESLTLALLGGFSGLLLGHWATGGLVVLAADTIPRFHEVRMEPAVLAFGFLAALLTALLIGLIPAVLASRPDLTRDLREGGRGNVRDARGSRWRGALIVAELALTLVLLIGAGLMVKSFLRLQQVDPGFRPEGALVAELSLPFEKYPERRDLAAFFDRFLAEIESLPQVEAAAAVAVSPFSDELVWSGDMTPERRQAAAGPGEGKIETFLATPGYAEALGLHLLRGRFLSARDREGASPVVVIDDVLARRYWPNENPVGRRIKSGAAGSDDPWMEVVGVVRQIQREALDAESLPQAYIPLAQASFRWPGRVSVVARTSADPEALIPTLRSRLRTIDPDQPFARIAPLEEIIAASISRPRLLAWLFTSFAALALIVASFGLYSVISYWVSLSTAEIGLRMAVGARRRDVLRLVLGRSLILTLLGLILGLLSASWMTRALRSVLFEVTAGDPAIVLGASLLLMMTALLACQLPAWRAARLDPGRILRQD